MKDSVKNSLLTQIHQLQVIMNFNERGVHELYARISKQE